MTIVAITVTETAANRLCLGGQTKGSLRFQNQGVTPVYRVTASTRPLSIPNDAWRYSPGETWESRLAESDAGPDQWLMCNAGKRARVVVEGVGFYGGGH